MANGGDKDNSVDLGLAALLTGGAASPTSPPNHSDDGDSTHLTSDDLNDRDRILTLSPYEQLAQNERWEEIVRSAEAALAAGDDVEARLWWIRGHLEAFSMPVSFLAAPLESVCRSLEQGDKGAALRSLLIRTGKIVMRRLFEVGDRDHMASLQRSLESAGAYEAEKYSKRPSHVASKSQFVSGAELEPVATVDSIRAAAGTVRAARSRWPIAIAIIALIMLATGVAVYSDRSSYFTAGGVIADEEFLQAEAAHDLVIPSLDQRDAVGSLSALYYSIEAQPPAVENRPRASEVTLHDSGTTPTQARSPTVVEAATATTQKSDSPGEGKESTVSPTSKGVAKEKIDTHGPVEGDEFRERKTKRASQRSDRPVPHSVSGDRRDPDPLVMEGRQDHQSGAGVYKVIAPTSVLSEPSYRGRVVGHLERDDTVLVEAQLGRWLRLRSRMGRGGFVLAEDVSRRQTDTSDSHVTDSSAPTDPPQGSNGRSANRPRLP